VRGLRFLDFSIRAWRDGKELGVLAHATPVGSMRQPVRVALPRFDARRLRLASDATLAQAAELGRELARLLLPGEVWAMLGTSLRAVASDPSLGIRLRLCLGEELVDLPWEFLYRPDVRALAARSGFLLMDERISLVREPPTLAATSGALGHKQRGVFVGTVFDDGADHWGVSAELRSLKKSLARLSDLVDVESAYSHDGERIESLLAGGCDFFHYGGHVDLVGDSARLVRTAGVAEFSGDVADPSRRRVEVDTSAPGWNAAEVLAPRLKRAGTRFVMLNACNSGYWPVARSFLKAGVACMVGVQGEVSTLAALNFSEKVYQSLAVGLSLDEAVTWARLYTTDEARSYHPTDWGRFMVYMPAASSVLFPAAAGIEERQRQARVARSKTVREVKARTEVLDGASIQRMLSDIASRSVLVLGRFTAQRKAVLDEVRRLLTALGKGYVPILFDFEKSRDRDLIESIVRFAAVSRFVIADLSDPKSVPAELQAIVPQFPSLPIVPIIEAAQREYPVSDNILRRESVCPVVRYRDGKHLATVFDRDVIGPAERLYHELSPPLLM
jgi:hypothetical protein